MILLTALLLLKMFDIPKTSNEDNSERVNIRQLLFKLIYENKWGELIKVGRSSFVY